MAVAVAAAIVIIATLGVATASLGVVYAGRAQAQAAADAGALASAVATYPGTGRGPPEVEASRVVVANGAGLVSCECPVDPGLDPRRVQVVARIDVEVPIFGSISIRGTARAEFDPGAWLGR